MTGASGVRATLALGVAALAAALTFLIDGKVESALIVLVCAIVAVLIALGADNGDIVRIDAPKAVPPPPPQSRDAPTGEVIEAIAEPVLLISHNRVAAANTSARALLGQHILNQDVRLAIRHPAAAERLLNPTGQTPGAPVHLVGLGTRDQRWELRVRELSNGQSVVHLIDRTGSYTADRIRVDFVANASHELRTPLASLLGFIETLADEAGDDPEMRRRFLGVMQGEAQRMQRLVDDLMSLSRIEAEKYRGPDQSVELGAMIEQVRAELNATDDPRGRDIVTDIAEVPPVRGDPAQLSQLIHNLVSNAMKYGRPGTPITIALRPHHASMIRLSVSDQGEGVPPEHLPRLTERFYRVDSGRSRAMGGTGLGLAIVKHIAERHRGQLDIDSEPGKGTTVSVLLPPFRLS